MPCGERYVVPRILVMPRLVATTRMGAMSFSSALYVCGKCVTVRSQGYRPPKGRVPFRRRGSQRLLLFGLDLYA